MAGGAPASRAREWRAAVVAWAASWREDPSVDRLRSVTPELPERRLSPASTPRPEIAKPTICEVLAEFLEQTLSSDLASELEGHLRDCEPCLAYLNTYRKTRGLVARAGQVEMPPELRARLCRFLLDRLAS